uniref:Ysc84 actin-binding domain-containing protein n=1 Tax=Mucochytrium quahogii TaxID=96639 RepID=A0A7S2WHM7_9STRA|mmetsp:Transcript_17049/g.27591  ORF Transcript_17049/g.27591 Transcript_17049/m.27591 type:complete len:239 (+) Transcript_17049:379-1095(+)
MQKRVTKFEEALLRMPAQERFAAKLKNVEAVVFLEVYRLGCIVTLRGAKGVILVKTGAREWAAPCAISFGGTSIGASIGLEVSEYIITLGSKQAVTAFMSGAFCVGLNGCLTLGPLGRNAEGMVSTGQSDSMTVFAASKGIYGGVSLEFSGIGMDTNRNKVEYEKDYISLGDFVENKFPRPSYAESLYARLDKLAQAGPMHATTENPTTAVPVPAEGEENLAVAKTEVVQASEATPVA